MLQRVLTTLDEDHPRAVERLKTLLAIPSLSADPTYRPHIDACAQWVANQLREIGLDVKVMPTSAPGSAPGSDGGPPCVVAHTRDADIANPAAPRVMFYGHYDVQPPDPVDKWTSPPFEPTVRGGAIYARGASDDKGQVLCFIEALRAWKRGAGQFPCRLTVLIEGEEEVGSVHLEQFLVDHKNDLPADIIVISDTSMWDENTPAITYALRGLLYYDLKLHGPSRDLHSGVYGGTLANPCTILTRVLGQLFDADHHVTIPGFYDDVLPIDAQEDRQWDKLGFSDDKFLGAVGAKPYGEKGFTTLQRRWARPSCDVNGIYGGYMGEGAKTVIPSFAGAKVSFRLAANQDAHEIGQKFERWLHSHELGGCRWELTNLGEANPVATPIDSPFVHAAQRAIVASSGKQAVLVREGATIPVCAWFKKTLGLDSLFVGFGLEGDKIHSPDEHFGLDRFKLGCRTHAAMLAEFGAMRA